MNQYAAIALMNIAVIVLAGFVFYMTGSCFSFVLLVFLFTVNSGPDNKIEVKL